MPGKQDPDFFSLKLSSTRFYEYVDENFENGHPFIVNRIGSEQLVGKFEGSGSDHGSGSATRRTRNVSLNELTMPSSENIEVEEDDEDDSVSIQSSDIDVDLDDMDTLVLSIHEKLRMNSNYGSSPNRLRGFWTDSYDNDDSNQSGCSTSSNCSGTIKRKRVRPYSWKGSQSSRQHSLATIQKQSNRATHHCHHWWTSKSFNDLSQKQRAKSNVDSPSHNDPYNILQELIESGSLIKEAVRRIKTKRLTHRTNISTSSYQLGSILSPNSTSAKIFALRNENSEISYPVLPLSAQ